MLPQELFRLASPIGEYKILLGLLPDGFGRLHVRRPLDSDLELVGRPWARSTYRGVTRNPSRSGAPRRGPVGEFRREGVSDRRQRLHLLLTTALAPPSPVIARRRRRARPVVSCFLQWSALDDRVADFAAPDESNHSSPPTLATHQTLYKDFIERSPVGDSEKRPRAAPGGGSRADGKGVAVKRKAAGDVASRTNLKREFRSANGEAPTQR